MENQVAAGAEVTATDAAVVSAEIPQKKKRKPINQQKLQDNLCGWAFCLPLIVGTVLFIYIALVVSLLLSFTNYCSSQGGLWDFLATMFSGGKPINVDSVFDMSWISGDFSDGGKNDPFFWYRFAFTEKLWSASLWQANNTTVVDGVFVGQTVNAMGATMFNTVFYLIGIPIGMVLAMFFAVCMSRDIKGGNVFRVLYYIPCVASSISIIYTFKIMFKTEGVINQILGTSLPWMMDGANGEYAWSPSIDTYWSQGLLSKTMIVIMSVWKGLGGTIILYVAGLSGVNAATKEAASIDGASSWTTFWKVTMPDLYPVIFYNVVTAVIGGMQIYAEPELFFALTSGHPNLMTSGYVSLIWHFGLNRPSNQTGNLYSLGAAYGMILAVIIFALTLFQFWLDGRKKD